MKQIFDHAHTSSDPIEVSERSSRTEGRRGEYPEERFEHAPCQNRIMRAVELKMCKWVSSSLTVIPMKEMDINLSKMQIRDGIKLR